MKAVDDPYDVVNEPLDDLLADEMPWKGVLF